MNVEISGEVKILILEDVATDAELIERTLRKAELRFESRRADTRETFMRALGEFRPDIILSDYNLPDFDGLDALKIVHELCPDVPLVEVTGALGDEAAVGLVRAGAADYVLKDRLARLPFAVRHALDEAGERRARQQSERELRLSEAKYRSLVETSGDFIWEIDERGIFTFGNARVKSLLGYEPKEIVGMPYQEILAPVERSRAEETFRMFGEAREPPLPVEHLCATKQGKEIAFETTAGPLRRDDGTIAGYRGISRDITERKQAEEKSREEEARFRSLVEQEIAGIYILSEEGTVVYLNPHFANVFGYTAEDVVGRSFVEFVAEMDVPRILQVFADQLNGKTTKVEVRLRRKNGDLVDVLAQSGLMSGGEHPVLTGVLVDISEQKQTERKLRASEERFRLLVENAPEAILVYDADQDRFIEANRNAEKLFDCGRDQLLKAGPQRFYAPVQPDGRPVPDSYAEYKERTLAGDVVKFERVIRTDAGRESLCDVTLVRLPSIEGRMLRASLVDVTERRRAEKAIAESELKLRTVLDTVGDGIVQVDGMTHRIVFGNRAMCRMLGYASDEISGLEIDDIHPPEVLDRVAKGFGRQLGGDGTGESNLPVKRKDGSIFFADVVGSPVVLDGRPSMVAAFHDVTELRRNERMLERLNRTLKTLSSANSVLVHAKNERNLFDEMCAAIVHNGGYAFCWIGIVASDAKKSVTPVAWFGEDSSFLGELQINWSDDERGQGPTGTAIKLRRTQVERDFETNPKMAPWREALLKRGFAATIALPLANEVDTVGCLTIYARAADAFDADEVTLLEELARDLFYGISALKARAEQAIAVERIGQTLGSTVSALASTVEVRDAYTAGHQRRVSELAAAIAKTLGFTDDRIQGILLAGIIHDVGKIQVPAEILSKPAKLTPLEFELIKCHAQAGYEIVKGIAFPWPVAEMIRQHHERLDGSGYPQGLKGDEILPDAKILAVADVVEAMMSHRPYRAALGLDAALAEIESGKGSRYDAAAVDACVRLFREKGFAFA
jgi:PAS domain S-box-containing protein